MFRPRFWVFPAWAALALAVQSASAGTVSYSVNSVSGGAPVSANITFTTVTGGLDITVTNTGSGTFSIAQAVSSLAFTVNGLSTPTAFTRLTGESFSPTTAGASWTLASGTAFDNTGGPVIDHWGFTASGANVLLATAGSPISGGKPQYLILPGTGTVGPGHSLAGNHTPDIIGPANFYLTVAGLTSGSALSLDNFSDLNVGWGTGPDSRSVPLPAAVWAGGSMLLLLAVRRITRRSA